MDFYLATFNRIPNPIGTTGIADGSIDIYLRH
jgi:hypothetical protein